MEKVDTFLVMQCFCPHCNEVNEPEFAEADEQELSEWLCDKCKKAFTYCHPENNYGL